MVAFAISPSRRNVKFCDESSASNITYISISRMHRIIEKRRTGIVELCNDSELEYWRDGGALHRKQYLDDSLTKRCVNVIHRKRG